MAPISSRVVESLTRRRKISPCRFSLILVSLFFFLEVLDQTLLLPRGVLDRVFFVWGLLCLRFESKGSCNFLGPYTVTQVHDRSCFQ